MKYGRIFLLAVAAVTALLLGTADVSAAPGDEDDDGLITGPRLVGNTTFKGVFVGGPDTPDAGGTDSGAAFDNSVDTITDALDQYGSWVPANKTELKNSTGNNTKADIQAAINAAKPLAPGDEFIFFFSGHGSDGKGVAEANEGGGGDNYLMVAGDPEAHAECNNAVDDDGDTRVNDGCPAIPAPETGAQCMNADDDDADGGDGAGPLGTNDGCPAVDIITDDELAVMLSGFKKSVTIVAILDECRSNTFTDGDKDLKSITQVNGAAATVGPRLGVMAAGATTSFNLNDPVGTEFTKKLKAGLSKGGDGKAAADNNPKDGTLTAKELADFAKNYGQAAKGSCAGDACPAAGCGTESTYDGAVPPDIDECPTQWGPVENNGCPIIIGGTVELLGQADSPADASGSAASRGYTAPLAAAAAGAVLALAAGGWYTRRRWLR